MLSEALHYFAESGNLGCTAHCLEAIGALLMTTGTDVESIAHMAGAADAFREASGQQHRPGELRGHGTMELALLAADERMVELGRETGRRLDLSQAVDRALTLLARGDG